MLVEELEPKKVFRFFKELSAIPHGSGNTAAIENYCIKFANDRGLKVERDVCGNVVIYKDASAGYTDHEPVILQGHLDMVCETVDGSTIDMEHEAVKLVTDGDCLWAEDTTLGADNGIAIAFALAVLDSENLKHPPIEALFTVDEEVGLIGASNLDASLLKGKRLINIDSEEEGVLTVSCAGAARVNCDIPVTMHEITEGENVIVEINVSGLLGGHSGVDIIEERKNAAKVMGEVLYELRQKIDFGIISLKSGGRLNVIPQTSVARISCNENDLSDILSLVQEYEQLLLKACMFTDPDISVKSNQIASDLVMTTDISSTDKVIFALMQYPHGVFAMSPNIRDLVQTSLNMGNVSLSDGHLVVGFMIRSNDDYGKMLLKRQINNLTVFLEGTAEVESDYPAWEYLADSKLRETMIAAYEDLYGNKPIITAMHAGLECGIISEKIPGGDFVSFGPTMRNVHTPNEVLDVHSAERSFKYLVHILEML